MCDFAKFKIYLIPTNFNIHNELVPWRPGSLDGFRYKTSVTVIYVDTKKLLIFAGQHSNTGFTGLTSWKTNPQTVGSEFVEVTFDNVSINSGEFYNSTNSSLICPTDGVYFVLITVLL